MLLASSPLSGHAYVGGGLIALFLVLFAETGLLIGFFLPGDTLLLLAGFYTKVHKDHPNDPHFNYFAAAVVCILGAFLGAQAGYVIGRQAGPRLFSSPQRREGVEKARKVIDRVGAGKAVAVARFIPLVRTFMNPAVGVMHMPAQRFVVANAVGAIVWPPVVLLLGRFLPESKEGLVDKVIIAVVIVSLIFPIVEAVRRRRRTPA